MRKKIMGAIAFLLLAGLVFCSGSRAENTVSVGDVVLFGNYEQDNNPDNGPEEIEWIVLEVKEGQAKLLSRYALDAQPFNTEEADVKWESCSLRTWLNTDFFDTAFSDAEQACLCTVTVPAVKEYETSPDPGNDTRDRVFLLDVYESERLFPEREQMICTATDYARTVPGFHPQEDGAADWLLRSPGSKAGEAAYVTYYGSVTTLYNKVQTVKGIRPVIVADLSGMDSGKVTAGVYTTELTEAASRARAEKETARLKELCIQAENNEFRILPGEAVFAGKMVFYIHEPENRDVTASYSSLFTENHRETFEGVPEEMLAESLDEADLAVFIYPEYENIGTYKGGSFAVVAVRTYTRVIVMDLAQECVYKAWDAVVIDPGKTAEVTQYTMSVRGRFAPEEAVQKVAERYRAE